MKTNIQAIHGGVGTLGIYAFKAFFFIAVVLSYYFFNF